MKLIDTIKRNRSTGIPTLIFGAPGVGKSQMVHQAAEGDRVIDIRLSMLDPVDLRGLPTLETRDGGTVVAWARPDFIPADGKGILFFDELNTAPPAVQNAALQIILDRRCGPHRLGDGWYIVAAGNKSSHRAHVHPLSAALRNRFSVIEYVPSIEEWTVWAMRTGIHADVTGFLAFRPALLTGDAKDEHANFPSPRSWERVSQFIQAGNHDQGAIASLVGRGAAAEFIAYRTDLKELPNIDALIKRRTAYREDPKRISVSYALAMALSNRVLNADQAFLSANTKRCCEIAASLSPEIAILFFLQTLQGSLSVRNAVLDSDVAHAWVSKHEHLLTSYGQAN